MAEEDPLAAFSSCTDSSASQIFKKQRLLLDLVDTNMNIANANQSAVSSDQNQIALCQGMDSVNALPNNEEEVSTIFPFNSTQILTGDNFDWGERVT